MLSVLRAIYRRYYWGVRPVADNDFRIEVIIDATADVLSARDDKMERGELITMSSDAQLASIHARPMMQDVS